MTISTTYFRENLAEVIAKVFAGEKVIMVFGKGKKAKQILLSNIKPETESFSDRLKKFEKSEYFNNFKASKDIMEYKNLKDYMKKTYNP
jgi:PHD/YefM family antitoxin component YafN of YafNO toxin-antitoxin module